MRLELIILVIVSFLNSAGPVLGIDGSWYFSPVEIEKAYRYQELRRLSGQPRRD